MDPRAGAVLLVALAGGIGSALRFAIAIALERRSELPWATLAVNVVGSFLLGVVAISLEGKRILGVDARVVLGTGLLGGFTTYSSFNLETLRMLERSEHGKAALYVGATLIVCMVAGMAGLALGRSIRGH
jgi:CrcB protein